MEVSSEEGEIPMPINSVYSVVLVHGNGHAHEEHVMTHHNHHTHHIMHDQEVASSTIYNTTYYNDLNGSNIITNNGNGALNLEDKHEVPYNNSNNNHPNSTTKKLIKFKECLKNHAASMGGNAMDGCGEFMANGEEGTLEALTCSACNCHRNFHRKEIVWKINQKHHYYHPHSPHFYLSTPHHQPHHILSTGGRKVILGSGHDHQLMKKRFRTKFSQEQKEKMVEFAEKVGWKIQRLEDYVVEQFCQEIGVKKRVLKVWMHNNKLTLAKNNNPNTT